MKYIIPLFIIYFGSQAYIDRNENSRSRIEIFPYYQTADKEAAFLVLQEKCNVCHATKKRTETFTLRNMDSLAQDIYKQVFVKHKMPKGRKIKLTDLESEKLRVWLSDILDVN